MVGFRIKFGSLAGCLLVVLALACLPVSAANRVQGMRLWQDGLQTRLIFDMGGRPSHSLSVADSPARLIIDLKDTGLPAGLGSTDFSGTPIRGIRTGMFNTSDLRIVLDLHSKVEPQSFLLPPGGGHGYRLVVDIMARSLPPPVEAPVAPPAEQPAVAVSRPPTKAASAVADSSETPVVAMLQPPATLVPPSGGRAILIAIDAGHGGEDPGAMGPRRVREKDVVLAIARELEKRINQQPGYKARMVRAGDYFVPLNKRREIARAAGADLFVSIHADAFTHSRAHGSSVYALSSRGATSTSAAFLAQRENGADLIGGVDLGEKDRVLASVLTDLSMTATMDASLGVGSRVLASVGKMARLHSRRVEQAGFVVLKSPDLPSILVETGFISNPAESERLVSPAYQRKMANAIFEGLGNYFLSNPPPDTRIAHAVRAGARPGEYVIARGDTLSGIAERYRVSVNSLVKTNGLADASGIRAGQRIQIPES